jgi:hypothetical protein
MGDGIVKIFCLVECIVMIGTEPMLRPPPPLP